MTHESAERIALIFEARVRDGLLARDVADRCIQRARDAADTSARTCAKCYRLDCGRTCNPHRYRLIHSWWTSYTEANDVRTTGAILEAAFHDVTILRAVPHPIADATEVWVQFPLAPTLGAVQWPIGFRQVEWSEP